MELITPLIFIGIFVVASLSLFVVYKFGMRKKSFEEALAEHRQQANAILGPKPKIKENKKSKKIAKKEKKEKPTSNASEEDHVESIKNELDDPHVEFKEEPEVVEIIPDKEVKEFVNKKRMKKQEKHARPILVKKTANPQENLQVEIKESLTPPNHFEEIQPKDAVELKKSFSGEELTKSETNLDEKKNEKEKVSKKVKNQKQEQHVQKNAPPSDPQPTEKIQVVEKVEEKIVEKLVAPQIQAPVVNSGKEKKKKKSEFNARQQITAERDQLLNSVRKAELSRTEVQLLIDLLLNKQLEAPEVFDEWSEGKSDPVQKLKKQLAEKENLLEEEQQALVGVQAKLKEVRSEQFAERAQWQQKVKGLEEAKLELVSNSNRLQQKLQEIQDQHNKEMMNFKQLIDENNAFKVRLMSFQETEGIMIQIRTENEHLGNELQRLNRELQEQQTAYVVQINNLQQELLDRKINYDAFSRKQIEETQLKSNELHALKQKMVNSQKDQEDLLGIIAEMKAENERLKKEQEVQLNGSSEEHQAHEVKVKNLTNELSSVRNELTSVIRKFQDAEQKYKVDIDSTVIKINTLNSELEEQKNKNNELRKKNWKVMEALNAAESRTQSPQIDINKISKEIVSKEQRAQKEFLQRLFPEIGDLKTASLDDWQEECGNLIKQYVSTLRQKAEKPAVAPVEVKSSEVAELNAQIKHYKLVIDDTDRILNSLQQKTEREERTWREKLLEKDVELEELKSSTLKQTSESPETPTDGIQFAYKCIEKSLPGIVNELQAKVSFLENQLSEERLEKERLVEERLHFASRPEPKATHGDAIATIERLSEEVDRLKEQLRIEQSKSAEVNGCPKAQNLHANSTNGPALTTEGGNS